MIRTIAFLVSVLALVARADQANLVIQYGNPNGVAGAEFSPDGRLLVTVGGGSTASLWEVESGKQIGAWGAISSASFSPDGRKMLLQRPASVEIADIYSVETRSFPGQFNGVYSPGGKLVATWKDQTVTLWDATSGVKVRTLEYDLLPGPYPGNFVVGIAFATQRSRMLHCDFRGRAVLWDPDSAAVIRVIDTGEKLATCAISPDGEIVVVGVYDLTDSKNLKARVRAFSAASGQELWSRDKSRVDHFAFSPDSRSLLTTGSNFPEGGRRIESHFLAADTGLPVPLLDEKARGSQAVALDRTGEKWAYNTGNDLIIESLKTGQVISRLDTKLEPLDHVCWGENTIGTSGPGIWSVIDLRDGHSVQRRISVAAPRAAGMGCVGDRYIRLLPGNGNLIFSQPSGDSTLSFIADLEMSGDGSHFAFTSDYKTVRIHGLTSHLTETYESETPCKLAQGGVSPSGRYIVCASERRDPKFILPVYENIALIDVQTKRKIVSIAETSHIPVVVSYDRDQAVAIRTTEGMAMYSLPEGRLLWGPAKLAFLMRPLSFTRDGHWLAVGSFGYWLLVDARTGEMKKTIPVQLSGTVESLSFSPDGSMAVGAGSDGLVDFWDIASGRQVLRYVALKNQSWAVVDAAGRYDASDPDGVDGLHWVVNTEPIVLKQLKQRFYEPELLIKAIKGEKLPDVSDLHAVKLFPLVEYDPPPPGAVEFSVKVTNRGGGIGRVRVWVNGKEIVEDARGPGFDSNAKSATLHVDLRGAPMLSGKPNRIEVIAFDAQDYLASRGVVRNTQSEGPPQASPEMYAIIAGIADYADPGLKLKYSAKDSADIATAIRVAGNRLFGNDRVHMRVLNQGGGAAAPNKANIRAAFEETAKVAKPGDLLFVYFAGHGIALKDGYCFITQEGRKDDLDDPALRERVCVTNEDLGKWMAGPSGVKALHQVMILDTCAAGAVAETLRETRDLGSDRVRAMELLKDRTGLYILMGSAADGVSFEANEYGQGLLTYSLLEGMRGPALKDSGEVDVSEWFNYATDQVPVLAKGIGGIQRPIISAPKGATFPVGLVREEDRKQIPLAVARIQILHPRLQNQAKGLDDLKLEKLLAQHLKDLGQPEVRGGGQGPAPVIYQDAVSETFPDAFLPTGNYTVSGNQIVVRINLVKDEEEVVKQIEVRGDLSGLEALASRVCEQLIAAALTANRTRAQ